MPKSMIIRIPPILAKFLRDSFNAAKKHGVMEDDELTVKDAILNELCNLPMRFEDRIRDAERCDSERNN